MHQSKHTFTTDTRKATAKTHLREAGAETDSNTGVRPACRAGDVESRSWRKAPRSSLAGFFTPCQWHRCFPEGAPDAISEVALSRRDPSVFHRIREQRAKCELPSEADSETTAASPRPPEWTQRTIESRTSITTLVDLTEGDSVACQQHQIPLAVTEVTSDEGMVRLRGPKGGTYTLERTDSVFVVYPGYGRVSELSRIEFADSSQEGDR